MLRRNARSVVIGLALGVALMVVALGGSGSAAAGSTPPSATPEQKAAAIVDPSLVLIEVSAIGVVTVPSPNQPAQQYSATAWGQCSGAAIATDYILTAGHCADTGEYSTYLIDYVYSQLQQNLEPQSGQAFLQQQNETPSITEQQAETEWSVSGVQLSFTIFQTPPAQRATTSGATASLTFDESINNGDVALLRTDDYPLPSLQVASGNPADGTEIVSFGYPGTTNEDVNHPSLKLTAEPSQTTGIQVLNDKDYISTGALMSPGVSGGPVTDLAGQVLGTNRSSLVNDAGQRVGISSSTSEVRRVLLANHISLALSPADQAWRTGLDDYFAGLYHQAVPEFDRVLKAFPSDLMAEQYRSKAIADYSLQSNGPSFIVIGVVAAAVLGLLVLGWLELRRRRAGSGHRAPADLLDG